MSVYSIANQPVKTGRRTNAGKTTGTQVPTINARKLGMGSGFGAFKDIVNQRVKRTDPYAEVRKQVSERDVERRKSYTPKEREDKAEKFIAAAKERWTLAAEAEAEIRKESLDDLKFLAGDQWPDKIKNQRMLEGRPCLTINQLPQFVRQVTNEQRQNRPAIQINPVDDEADPDTAEVLQGLIRHIEYDSSADAAYDTAFFGAAVCGFGYFLITTEYSGPMSFEQDIKIKRIRNPFTVYMDPNAKEPDFSDANFCFVTETLSKDDYTKQYPESKLSELQDWQSTGDTGWVDEDTCRIVEYFWRETTSERIVQLSDGSVLLKEYVPHNLAEGVKIVNERETEVTTVKWAKLNGVEVLEETEWAGQWIPVVKVVGDEFDIDGRLVLKGIVRDAKEPQQQYNFMKSASTEAIALAPKAPYIGAEGQFENHEQEWQNANRENRAFLSYKPVALGGAMAPPPQRNVTEPAIQAINMATVDAASDLQKVTGIYAAALGEPSNEISGIAIQRRQQQTQSGNFHYIDNLTRAMRHAGRILLELIPKIYDTERVVRIIGAEGEQKTVTINAKQQEGLMEGVQKVYDLTVGKYDVTVNTGPSYQSRRQEAVASIIDLTKAFPPLMGVAGDILVRNMDWPGAEEIADRMKKALPPQYQDDEDNQNPLPPQVQQHIAQLTQQNQQMQQALQQAQMDVQQHVSVKKIETDSRERIAANEARLKELELQVRAAEVQADIVKSQALIDAKSADATAKAANDFLAQIAGEHHEAALQQMQHEQSMTQVQQGPQFSQQNAAQQVDQQNNAGEQ